MPPKKNSREDNSANNRAVPDRLTCPVCMEVPQRVMLTDECGHLFCESCITKLLEKDASPACPVCNVVLTKDTVRHNVYLQREVNALPVQCPSEGCAWNKERSELAEHLKQCPEAVVPCPHAEEGCEATMKHKDIVIHETTCDAARVPCPNHEEGCEELLKRADIEKHLSDHCEHQRESCKNDGCEVQVKRKDVETHENECPEAVIPCPHSEDGCTATMKRKMINEHIASNQLQHLQLQMATMKKANKALQEKCTAAVSRLERLEANLERQTQCVVKLPIAKDGEKTYSDEFTMYAERWKLKSYKLGCHRSIFLMTESREQYCGNFKLKLIAKNEESGSCERNFDTAKYCAGWGANQFIDNEQCAAFTVDDAWYVDVSMLRPPSFSVLQESGE